METPQRQPFAPPLQPGTAGQPYYPAPAQLHSATTSAPGPLSPVGQPPVYTPGPQIPGLPPTYPQGPQTPNQPPAHKGRGWLIAAVVALLLVNLLLVSLMATQLLGSASLTSSQAPQATAPASVQDLQQAIITVAKQVQPSVVEITGRARGGQAVGSGVILTQDGYIATNDHVIRGFSNFVVALSNGRELPAQVVGQSPQNDLAVLKVTPPQPLQPITFADSSQVQVGQFAIAVGSPLGLEDTVTFGIVSALNRTASELPDGPATRLTGLIQTSAPINPGNSGGALVDLQGRLIGMPTLGARDTENNAIANDIGFAIPSNLVKQVSEQIIQQAGG